MNQELNNKGIVIAELTEKQTKKDKNNETYYLLKLSIRKNLTQMYFELRNEKPNSLPKCDDPLFVFTNKNKNRFAYTLMTNCIYLFKYSKKHQNDTDYLHVEDWKKLGDDKRVIERSYRALLDRESETEDEEITNQELLLELKKRIKEKRIVFNLSAADNEADRNWTLIKDRIDIELKNTENNFSIDLQEEWTEPKNK